MPSLRELQKGFADAVFACDGAALPFAIAGSGDGAERIAIYRRAIFANYRNALVATYPVVRELVGAPFFNAAADNYVRAHPSVSGDLNAYGDAFGDFLASYPHAAGLPYLPDVARLEWSIDEANRAVDSLPNAAAVVAMMSAVAPDRLPSVRLRLAPSCRLVASDFPILRIWQVHQSAGDRDLRVDLDVGGDAVLVGRGIDGISLTRLTPGEYHWLAASAAGQTLGDAIDAAQRVEPAFDFAATLRTHLATGTIAAIAAD
jgi:hypothetical protein